MPKKNRQLDYRQANGKRQKVELDAKIQIGGFVHYSVSSSINGLDASKPVPMARIVTFVRAFKAVNSKALIRLHSMLVGALRVLGPVELGKNGDELKVQSPAEWMASLGVVQIVSDSFTGSEPWHYDGGASFIHIGLTLYGSRHLVCRVKADTTTPRTDQVWKEITLDQKPGSFYLSNICGVEHQVRHSASLRKEPADNLWTWPTGSGTRNRSHVSVMLRTSLFRFARGRCQAHLPGPLRVFELGSAAVSAWLKEVTLQLPTLRDCLDLQEEPSPTVTS